MRTRWLQHQGSQLGFLILDAKNWYGQHAWLLSAMYWLKFDFVVEYPFGSSDRKMIHLTINCPIPKIKRKLYLYSNGDCDSFNQELDSIAWDDLLYCNDMKTNWDKIKRINQNLLNKVHQTELKIQSFNKESEKDDTWQNWFLYC